MGTLRDMQESEEERSAHPADKAASDAGYQALADFERWSALGAAAPELADRLGAAAAAGAAQRRLEQGARPQRPDERLDEAERRVRPQGWWEALARAYHWQRLTAAAYGVALDPAPQQWAAARLERAAAEDQAIADRLALVERRLAGEALVLRHALGGG
jgi:hypothetical protein